MNRYAGLKFKYRGCTSGIKRRREKRERERITLKFWFMAVVAEKQKWKGDRRNSWWYLSNTFHLFRNTLILWSIQSRVRKRIQEEYIYSISCACSITQRVSSFSWLTDEPRGIKSERKWLMFVVLSAVRARVPFHSFPGYFIFLVVSVSRSRRLFYPK